MVEETKICHQKIRRTPVSEAISFSDSHTLEDTEVVARCFLHFDLQI